MIILLNQLQLTNRIFPLRFDFKDCSNASLNSIVPAQPLLKFKGDFSGQPQRVFDSYPLYVVMME